ncbi:MAG: molybdopterin-dependent oxidoreductase [Myxococcales bacterium]|nr:molybdopterin-dependent oxidoreductase [Myxococcales bacterium]
MAEAENRIAHRTCPLCEAACGLEIHVEGEKVSRIRGDKQHVLSHGFVCPKGVSLDRLHTDPDRLRRPLVKRKGAHVEVDWDEAYAEIEERMLPLIEKYGRNAVGIYLGNPNVHNQAGYLYVRPLIKSLATRNIYSSSTVDQIPRQVSSGLMFGSPFTMAVPDLDHTDLLLLLGTNPFESNGSLCTAPDFPGRIRAIQARGGRVIVVDPRRTRTARAADDHIFIRPGTDSLLLVAMLQAIFEEGLADVGALGKFLNGVEEIAAVVSRFAPERVADRCGIPAPRIRELAVEVARADSAAIHGRIGIHTCAFGTLASWAVDALSLLTGNLDRRGGSMFPRAAHSPSIVSAGGSGFQTGRWKSRVRGLPEVMSEFPAATLADEILTPGEGQMRGLVSVAGNPVLSTPDAGRLDEALAQLEFMVSVDIYCNETSRHADVILPPPSPLERSHYDVVFTTLAVRNFAHYSPAVFDSEGPSEGEILSKLTLIFGGQGAGADPGAIDEMLLRGLLEGHVADEESPVFGREIEELLAVAKEHPAPDAMLDVMIRMGPYGDAFGSRADGLSIGKIASHPHGIDLGPLEPRLPELLSTPSARIELAPPAILADFGRLDAALSEGDSSGLLLVGRRDIRSNNSWMHNIGSLVSGKDRCRLHLHPRDAASHGVADAEEILLVSRAGRIQVVVEVTEDIMPGVVSLPHGWGHDRPGTRLGVAQAHAGVNSNVLTDSERMDPLSGNAVLNGIPVSIESARPS